MNYESNNDSGKGNTVLATLAKTECIVADAICETNNNIQKGENQGYIKYR